jgi:uncharacterized protein
MMSAAVSPSLSAVVNPKVLAGAWSLSIIQENKSPSSVSQKSLSKAVERTIPLLKDAASVPFVCRYRTDIINPLKTKQVHLLQSFVSKHDSLSSLRLKLLEKISHESLRHKIQTSISKTELEDFWAPFKTPSKGSILERIKNQSPDLVDAVDKLWHGKEQNESLVVLAKDYSRDSLIHLLGCKIAGEPETSMKVAMELSKHCRIRTGRIIAKTKKKERNDNDGTYRNYENFSMHLKYIKDHQVLAIRRGVDKKAINMIYDIDGTKMEEIIRHHLLRKDSRGKSKAPEQLRDQKYLLNEAIHDAWNRLLRRRGTNRLWSEKCKEAEERAVQVFKENLKKALLAPPRTPSQSLLALDPGFRAGIKSAILDASGNVAKLKTIKYLGNNRRQAVDSLVDLLTQTRMKTAKARQSVLVALGNGHGSQDCRRLIYEASEKCSIPIEVILVNEAGASVWSVTEPALEEFPKEIPSSIASISIGRRLQNPLFELVKIPPKSLGLGMYQHDLSEKELNEKLHSTIVDAVAMVGVDVNTCSMQVLQKVPGLSKLAEKVVKARPIAQRKDLLNVSGLGPKTFENCAGFLRISNGSEHLDDTLVHPESYDVARWLMETFSWNLPGQGASTSTNISVPRTEWQTTWAKEIAQASNKFSLSEDRVTTVLENLLDSILKKDPRRDTNKSSHSDASNGLNIGSIKGCSLLSPKLVDIKTLERSGIVRGVIGTIRNIADFGAFVDFGGPNNGLLHTSKLGPLEISKLLIGQQIGVDILSVDNKKISLAVAGLNLKPAVWHVKYGKGAGKRSVSAASNSSHAKRRRRK